MTDEVCNKNKNIKEKPIVFNAYSQAFPDQTLVDLPGVAWLPIGSQPKNIGQITKDMDRI